MIIKCINYNARHHAQGDASVARLSGRRSCLEGATTTTATTTTNDNHNNNNNNSNNSNSAINSNSNDNNHDNNHDWRGQAGPKFNQPAKT